MVDLQSIRISYAFTSFFYVFAFPSIKRYAFFASILYVYIRTNQTVTYWRIVFQKKCYVKYSPILKYRSHRSCTKYLNKIFINM